MPARIVSPDQFCGRTVLSIFVVNHLGAFAALSARLQHFRTYCSYADTIMPLFLFAAGFAYSIRACCGCWPQPAKVFRPS